MPRGDGTGPKGKGPITGRGQGACNSTAKPFQPQAQGNRGSGQGAGKGRGKGQDRGAGQGRGKRR